MASIETLPADQRAVLELVLRRGRSYDEIARLLSIDRAGVRQRALAAFDTLGPQTRVGADRRALIADYLLDALPGAVADEVRNHLQASASERAWARAIASELQGLAEHPLPEIPANGSRPQSGATTKTGKPAKPTRRAQRRAAAAPAAEIPLAAARTNGGPRRSPPRPSSRVGGAILLGLAAAIAIALVLVFVVFSGGTPRHHAAARAPRPAATPTTTSASNASVLAQIKLTPPSGGSAPVGIAEFVRLQGHTGVVLAAEGLTPNRAHPANYYALWFYNSATSSELVGVVKQPVTSNGRLETAGAIPANARKYQHLLVTLETISTPKSPGRIVLEGTVSGL